MDLIKWMRNQWDRFVAAIAATAGGIFILLGWLGASGSSLATQQIPYLASGAVAGLFALGLAATLWLSADLRDEWRTLEAIREELHQQSELLASSRTTNGSAPAARSRRRQPVTVDETP